MRIYDPRVGRFLSVDPISKKYPELTPYQFASNNAIHLIDIDGLEGGIPISYAASNPLGELVSWGKIRHQRGQLNWDVAEQARKTTIAQGRANGDNITWLQRLWYIWERGGMVG